MKARFFSVTARLFAATVLATGPGAQGATLTFEDLDPSPALYDVMPTPYAGFTFTNWLYGPDTVYTPRSGVIDLFTDYADPGDPFAWVITNDNAIASATGFVFDGAWFSGYSGATFELWYGGSLVHTSDTLPDALGPDPYGPTFLASGYAGSVDRIVVSAVQGFYAMDDFTFRRDAGPELPEPGTLALGVLALAAAAARRRKKEPIAG